MARQALGIVGTVIGSTFGPVGGAIGGAIGGFIGGLIDPPDPTRGPRLDDLRVPAAEYGAAISRAWGTVKLGSALIWVLNDKLIEREVEQSVGKGGGPTSITYSYFASFAVLAHDGEIRAYRRLWADGKLIYDTAEEGLIEAIANRTEIPLGGWAEGFDGTFYLGDATQDPDPLIETDPRGLTVPDWRGYAYIVFDEMPLAQFGGSRIPTIEAEIVVDGAPDAFLDSNFDRMDGDDGDQVIEVLDPFDPYFFQVEWTTSRLTRFSRSDLGEDISVTLPLSTRSTYSAVLTVSEKYLFIPVHDSGVGVSVLVYDKFTLAEYARLTGPSLNLCSMRYRKWSPFAPGWLVCAWADLLYPGYVAAMNVDLIIPGSQAFTVPADASHFTSSQFRTADIDIGPNNEVWVVRRKSVVGGAELFIGTVGPVSGFDFGDAIDLSGVGAAGRLGVFYWPTEDCIVLLGKDAVSKLNKLDGSEIATYDFATDALGALQTSQVVARQDGNRDGALLWFTSLGVTRFDLASMAVEESWPLSSWTVTTSGASPGDWYDHQRAMFWFQTAAVLFLPRAGRTTTTVQQVISDVSADCGVPVDVSLVDQTIRGYAIRAKSTGRDVVENDLMATFQIDAAEVDGAVKFIPRGQAASITYTSDDLGYTLGEQDGLTFSEKIERARDLPSMVTLSYVSDDAEFRPLTQSTPDKVAGFTPDREATIQTSAVLNDDLAKQLTDRHLRASATERRMFSLSFAYTETVLHSADVIEAPIDTATVTMRVRKWIYDGTMRIEAVNQDASDYISALTGAGVDVSVPALFAKPRTELIPLDIPILRENDDGTGAYFALYPTTSGQWDGAVVFQSDDRETFNEWHAWSVSPPVAVAQEALATGISTVFDRGSSLMVRFISGDAPASITELATLNEGNAFAIGSPETGWEIANVSTITDNGDGTYTLSDFLRGRRGTEWRMASHFAGEQVVFLSAANLRRYDALRGAERFYAPFTYSTVATFERAIAFTNTDVGLKPYSVVQAAAADSGGDTVLTWTRRSRVGGEWTDGADVPLGEDSEVYEVDILDGSDAVLRTLSANAETATYTAADQATDGDAGVTAEIYQLSATVGRGYATEVNL